MLTLLFATAFAADMHPGLVNPSAVRTDDTLAVQVSGGVGQYTALLSDGQGFGGTVQVGADLTDRFRLGAYAGVGQVRSCYQGLFGGGSCEEGLDTDLVLSASYAVVDQPRFRVAPFVAAGTYLQAGVALWWQARSERYAFDLSWGPSAEVFSDGFRFNPQVKLEATTFLPEMGLTFRLDPKERHALRVGLASAIPNLTYRFDTGPVALEATAGTIGFVSFARAGVSVEF